MALTEDQKASIRQRQVNDLKQACLDLAAVAGELFDRFEAHGLEAVWEGDGALVAIRLSNAYEAIRAPLAQQGIRRLRALGLPFSELLEAP